MLLSAVRGFLLTCCLVCVCVCVVRFLQVHEKASSDLSVVPENEPLDSDTEAEKNLVERIKSIKQEK